MTIEAMQTFGWKSAGIALRLRNHWAQVQTLKRFRQAVQEIPLFGVRILPIDPTWLDPAAGISQQTGLLHNDALVIAVMRAHSATDGNLANGKAEAEFNKLGAEGWENVGKIVSREPLRDPAHPPGDRSLEAATCVLFKRVTH
jgi:hypothetical protein